MIHADIFVAKTIQKGWGVFTKSNIAKDTVVEISPVVVMTGAERKLIDQTLLYNYIFEWENDQCCMAMGLIPIYNHAFSSNCEYFQDYDESTIFIKTVREIKAGEELCINYNGDWDNNKALWFEVK